MTWSAPRMAGRYERARRGVRARARVALQNKAGKPMLIEFDGSWADLLDRAAHDGFTFGVEVAWTPDRDEWRRRKRAVVGTINKSAQRRFLSVESTFANDFVWFRAYR